MSGRDQDIREAILAALPGDLAAVPLSQIEARLLAGGASASRRTLQRHLAVLEQDGRVVREGRSVAVTYRRAEGNALRFGIRRSQFEAWVRRREA